MSNTETMIDDVQHEKVVAPLSKKQQSVLKASLVLFSKVGYDRTSTYEIAKLAGVSEGTVFSQFKTKNQLLHAVLEPFIGEVLPLVASDFVNQLQTESLPHFVDFLNYIVHDRMSFVMGHRSEFKIFVQEMGRNPQLLIMLTSRLNTLINHRLSDMLQDYQNKGELIEWDPMRISRYIVSVILGYLLPNTLMSDEPLDIEQQTQECVAFLMRGLSA
ncbi:TetR/AcrR family transcriptional regulator [Lapidilactobacillus bayanensis]|uniref:TetR/AcrR family transcriptional regulator n=1 Tax=Lapidilactobacillus bayanensis TaxID=2485998 RepID=UPI000F794875|nr:TetR/AcrR family transcriptional regulator [Lapidilactobacillus bayanensis]